MEDEERIDNLPETPDDGDVTQELADAMHKLHPEELPPEEDLFATDGLGNEPAEEDDQGRL